MKAYEDILDHIRSLVIMDTHEHLPDEDKRPRDSDVLSEWLTHYFSSDLVSAGLSDKDLASARDARKPLKERWRTLEPFWRAAENTGYGRALAISARDIYGIDQICGRTIAELDRRFKAARDKGGHYRRVLGEMSRIAVSIRDSMPVPYAESGDPFVYTMRIDPFVLPAHYNQIREIGRKAGIGIHCLDDWMSATRWHLEKYLDGRSRVVCLKCGLAYRRSLRFDKVSRSEAEKGFNRFFDDNCVRTWQMGVAAPKAFSDWMMHFICGLADERGLVMQVHTGLQEGNGNIICDSNPTLLSNILLEYGNARFDLFHMGYPYVMETGNLAKNFRNVSIDMCWGHIISPEAARRALVEWIDAVPANKISAFGGDYCFIDGVYGHQCMARENVARSLALKVEDGSISLARALEMAGCFFVDNPRRIFGLDRFLTGKKRKKSV